MKSITIIAKLAGAGWVVATQDLTGNTTTLKKEKKLVTINHPQDDVDILFIMYIENITGVKLQ